MDYNAPKVAHIPGCPDAPSSAKPVSTADVLDDDRYTRHHGCVPPYNAPPVILLADADDAPHAYEPSCIWPADEPRSRCRICWGTH